MYKNYLLFIKLNQNLGWWTYEFCFGKYASQYHLLSKISNIKYVNLNYVTKIQYSISKSID